MSLSQYFGLQKIIRYEFWPYWIFYAPFLPQWLWYSLRSGSLCYFTATNPKMRNGGFVLYSKSEAMRGIAPQYLPKYQLVKSIDEVNIDFSYPIIAKPDKGERGKGVEKINSDAELQAYFSSHTGWDIILQEYIDLPLEFGVFFCQIPNGEPCIISVTAKEFLSVVGDGHTTLGELMKREIRVNFERLAAKFDLNSVPAEGERIWLEPIGNHSRGTTFLNANHLISKKMVSFFRSLVSCLPEFYYGRLDVRCGSVQDLETGQNLKVLEVNGANSEIAHIYQPGYGLWRAYRDVAAQMHLLWKISYLNHKRGIPYTPFSLFVKDVFRHQQFK